MTKIELKKTNHDILHKQEEIIELEYELEEMKYQKYMFQQRISSYVIGDYDAHGKSRFSNAESREAERAFRMDKDENYQKLRKEVAIKYKKISTLKNELDWLKREYEISLKIKTE